MNSQGNFVITWQSFLQDGSQFGIYAHRFDAAGVPQGDKFAINTHTTGQQQFPAVAMDSAGNFAVVWQSVQIAGANDIFGLLYDKSGQAH